MRRRVRPSRTRRLTIDLPTLNRPITYVGTAVLIVAAVVVGQLTASGTHRGVGGGAASQPVTGLASTFRQLRHPEEKPPPSVESSIELNLDLRGPLQIIGSYPLDTPLGTAWLVTSSASGKSMTCLALNSSRISSCSSTRVAKRIGLALGRSEPVSSPRHGARSFTILGMVPDWVRFVKATPLGMTPLMLRVVRNTFTGKAPAPLIIKKYCARRHSACVTLQ
jgi:hypothetical protein